LLGQCCIHQHEAVEAELREPPVATGDHASVESSEPYFHSNRSTPRSRQGAAAAAGGAAGGTALPEPSRGNDAAARRPKAAGAPPGGGAAAGQPGEGGIAPESSGEERRYLIDNSILKIQGPPGVAYRYTKRKTDKVKQDVQTTVAKWGEVVVGVDQGDGWLKVGQYYLPMIYEGTPVITPIDVSSAAAAGGSAAGGAVAGGAVPSPGAKATASRLAPPSNAVGSKASSPAKQQQPPHIPGPPSPTVTTEPPAPTAPATAALVSAPAMPPQPAEEPPSNSTEPTPPPTVTAPVVAAPPLAATVVPKSTSTEVQERKLGVQTDGDGASKSDEPMLSTPSTVALSPPALGEAASPIAEPSLQLTVAARVASWPLQPSVGTWLQARPTAAKAKKAAAAREEEKPMETLKAAEASGEVFQHLPSVGTWLFPLPASDRKHAATATTAASSEPSGLEADAAESKLIGDDALKLKEAALS